MKVLSVVGNRPQFIKSAPTSIALRDAGIDAVVLHTGQHYDREMSEVFFDEPRFRSGATDATSARPTSKRQPRDAALHREHSS